MFSQNNENVDGANERIPFVGRRREVEEIKAWFRLSRYRLVQIYGPPFTGKHRLANQVQNELISEYEEKQMSLRCINTSGECLDWNEWLKELANTSGAPVGHDDIEHTVLAHLIQMANNNRLCRFLLVFTKVDFLVQTSVLQNRFINFCQKILRLTDNIFLIVTSQMRIAYPSSMQVRALILSGVSELEGVTLFQNVAQECTIDLTAYARDIVRGCWYLPGIITEAAMLLSHPQRVVGIEDLVTIAQTPGSLMKILSFHKHKLQTFFDRMSKSVKKGAVLLTLFQGSFSKSAATEIISPLGDAGGSDCTSLVGLCDHSLVSRSTNSDRYEIPAFLHEFLTEEIHDVAELNPARMQFVKFFCRTLHDVDQKVYVHGREGVLGYLHGDFDNVRQLMQQTMHCTQEMFPLLMQTVVAAEELFGVCFSDREVQFFYDSLMNAASVFGTKKDTARILWLMAQNSNFFMTNYDKLKHDYVLEQCKTAYAILQIDGPSYELASVTGLIGLTYNRKGLSQKGRRLLLKALEMLSYLERNAVVARREVTLLSHLAISEVYLEMHSNVERTVDRAMQIACRETPHHPAIAVMLNTMGLMFEQSGRSQVNAMRYYKWSLEERRKHSYFRAETLYPALLNVSLQFVRTGNCNAALQNLGEALEFRRQYGWLNYFTAVTLYYIGIFYMQMEKFSLALDYHQQAFNMFEQCTPEHPTILHANNAIAHCYLAMNDELNARRSFDVAIAKYSSCKTINISHKICTLRHCLLLGNTQQRQSAYSCLQTEWSEMPDSEMIIDQRISECMALFSTDKGECWNWNDNGRELLSKHCKLCQNRYRMYPHGQSDHQINTSVISLCMDQSQRQQSNSSDSGITKTQTRPSESSHRGIAKFEKQPSESSDLDITKSERQPHESSECSLTKSTGQPSKSSDRGIAKFERQPSESSDMCITKCGGQLSESCNSGLTETKHEPSESSDRGITKSKPQLLELSDCYITKTQTQPLESSDCDSTRSQPQTSVSSDCGFTRSRTHLCESFDCDITRTQAQPLESSDQPQTSVSSDCGITMSQTHLLESSDCDIMESQGEIRSRLI